MTGSLYDCLLFVDKRGLFPGGENLASGNSVTLWIGVQWERLLLSDRSGAIEECVRGLLDGQSDDM